MKMGKQEFLVAPNYTFIQEHLLSEFNRVSLNGKNILILGPIPNTANSFGEKEYNDSLYYRELKSYFENKICKGNVLYDLEDIQILNSQTVDDEAFQHSVVISSAYDIFLNEDIIKSNKSWFEDMGLVVFENITGFVSYNRIWSSILSDLLVDYCQCKVIFLANEKQKLKDMVATEFNLQPGTSEDYLSNTTNFIYFTCWNRENQSISDSVLNVRTNFVSTELLVLAMAYEKDISDKYYVNHSTQPYIDHLEELEEEYKNIRNNIEQHFIQCQLNENNRFIVSDDLYNNISYLLYSHQIPDVKKTFLNICSKPYLFRDFMANNIHYFNQYVLKPFAPKIKRSNEKNKLLTLYEILRRFDKNEKGYSEKNIRDFLSLNVEKDIFSYLVERYKALFNRDISKYLIESKSLSPKNLWELESSFKIDSIASFWLDENTSLFSVVDVNNNKLVYDYIPQDLVEQFFFSSKSFDYDQNNYILNKIDREINRVFLEKNTVTKHERVFLSKVINKISLVENEKENLKQFIENKHTIFAGVKKVLNYYTFKSVTVKSYKRYDFKGENTFDYTQTEITERDNKKSEFGEKNGRTYKNEKTLLFSLNGLNSTNKNTSNFWSKYSNNIDDISQTLAYLIKEALVSFLPQSYQFIDVLPIVDSLTPACSDSTIDLISSTENNFTISGITILFIEDAIQDLGLLAAIKDNFDLLLRTIDDYLHWYITHYMQEISPTGEIEEEQENIEKPKQFRSNNNIAFDSFDASVWKNASTQDIYSLSIDEVEFIQSSINVKGIDYKFKTDFLRNIDKKHADFLKLKELKDLLHFFLGDNNETRNRISFQKNKEQVLYPPIKNGDEIHQCDFCSKSYPLKDLVILKDGRERCVECSKSALDKKEDYKDVFKGHVQEFFKSINQKQPQDNLDVLITYADVVNKPFGGFTPTPYFDSRALGYAQSLGNEYKILTENGSPKKQSILTIIHEWVHIWQYVNIDYKKLEKDYDKYFIEGHTTWSEIYYASQVKNWGTKQEWENKIAPTSRKDEYGDGYRLVNRILKKSGMQDPFLYLLKFYPKK